MASGQQVQSSNHVSKESQTSFIGDKSDAQPSLRTPVTSSSRVLRASRFHNCDKKSGIAEVPPVFVNQRVDKTVKYPRVTVYGLPSKFQVRDVKAVVDKRTKPCAFPRSQKTYLGFSNSSTLSKSLVPCTISTRNQTARKSFPFVRNGRKDGFNVVSVHNALEKSVENNPSIVCDGSNLATLPLKDVTDDDGVNGSLVNYSGLSELKIKSLHCSLHNMPNNMADPKVPVVMIDDSIKKALRDGYSGSQSVISQFQTDSSVIYKGCSNFEIVKHVEHAKVDMEVGDQAIISSIGNVEMPPLLCPSRTNQDYSDRESSKSPEMPILTPFGLETMESDECDAPSLLIKDTVTVNQDVTDSSKSAEVILQSPEGVSNQETTVSSSSNESPKRTPRTEVHFQGRYAYMVGKRIRDPSRFIEHSRDVMKRSTRPRGRPPSVLSRLKLWYDKNSRIAGGSVQKVHGKSFCRSVLKPGRRPIGRSNPFGSEMLIEQSGRTKRGRPRLRRGCPNSISLEQNPHVDVIDGLEFLSFETESDLKGFLRRHPSYTLNMSRLNELDTNGFLLSSNCNTTEVNVDNMNSPKLRLPGEPIVLTKTNDIRRIKGWRNKIFVPEALDDWNMDPDKLRELSMEQRLLLLANFTPEELKERGLWELVASKYGTVKRDEEIIEHRVGRSVVNEFGQILFDNRDIKDTCIPEISKSLESEQPLESKTSVEKEEVVSQKGEKQLDGTSGNCVNVECDAQHSIEQVENCTVKEELPVDSQVQVTSEPATYKSANEANASQSNKSAFVSDFLNEFLRSHSELKISTALSAEQEQKATNTIDTKVVWPAQDNYPVQVFPSKQMISNLPPPVTPAVKRTYHRRIRVDERPPPSKKLTKDSKPMQPAVASNNNVASVRVMIEPVQMSMTDALFATTALVSRSLWDKDLGLLPSPEDIAKVFRSEVSESLECLQRKEAMRQKFSVLISPCHALQAVSAVPPQYCGSPSSLSTKDLKSISILKLRPEFKEASVGKAPVVSRSTSLISDKRNQHNKDPLCTVPVKKCSEPFCELGCVCSSLKGVKRRRIHCGKIQCMFKCICEESVNSEVQSSDGNSPQPLKRRRQIRLPARLKDSLFLWTKGKSPLPNYVSNQVNIVPSIDKAAVEVVKARSSVLLKRPSPNSLCASSRSPLITVIQKKTDSSINAEASKHSNTGSSNKSSSCTKFAVGISSCLPPQKSVTKKSNGLPANSPMLLMVDHPLPSGQTHNVGGRSTCHLLLNPDGTMVPCMIVPIDLNASAESAADPLTPVTLTSVDPVPSSVAEVPVQRPIIRQMTSSALENNKPSITYTRQTARKSVNSMMEQSRIQKEVLQKLNVVKKQSVDKVSSVIKDVVDKMVRKVVMDEKLLEGAARSCRLSKARMTLTRCLNSQGNGSYIGSKVDGNKLRIAGLPHDWRSISKPLDEFPEFGGSLQKLQEVQEVIHKPESQVQQSVDDDTTVASPVESANRADLHRQLEKKRRHEIRNSLHQLSSLITPYIFNSKEQKVSQIPVQQCVLDMTTEVIGRLQEDERELLASKQNLIKHRMGLFKSYTELLQGLDMVKQKETIAELATKIQDCLKERSQRRQKSQDLPLMIESLNISSMSSYFFPNIDVDSSESNSVHTLCESDNDLSDISLFESSDEEITDQDDDQEKCKSVGPVVTGSEIGTHTSSLEPVVQVKNGGDQDTAVSILPIITNSFSERQPIEDACPNSLEAVSDSVPDCDVELNAAEISKTAYSSNGQLKNNGTSNDSSIKSPPTENYECNLPKLKEINVSTYKSGASSWIPLHSIASSGGEVTLLTRKKINSPTTAPSNEISLLAKKLTAPSVAQGSDVTLSTKNKVLPLTITPGTEVTLISKNQVVDEKSLNEMHKESTKPKLLPLSQQLEKLIPGTGTKKPSGQLISKADSILNQISDCKKPLTIFGATTVTPIIVPNKSSDSSLKPSTPDNRDCVIKPVISSVHSRNGIRNVPTQATPVSLVRNVFRSPSRKYNQHSLREIPSYPNKSANSVNGNIIPLLPKSSGLNAAPVVITPVSNFLQKKKCQLGTGYYLEVVPANVGSQFPKELSVNSTTNVSNPTSSAHSISDKVTPVLITSQVSFCSNNNNSLSNTRPTTEEAPYCVSDGYKDSNVLTSSLLQNENSSDSTSFPTLSSQSRDPEESDGLTNSIEESEETCQESKELSCESDDAPSDDWFKIVAFKSITEDEFWCKDNSAQDCAT